MGGQEVFAKWVPEFVTLSHNFVTDANGYDLVSHSVYKGDRSSAFEASFVPVTASITA